MRGALYPVLGAGSGLVEHGRLLAHDEHLIAHFQDYVRERLLRAVDRAPPAARWRIPAARESAVAGAGSSS